MVMRVLLDVNVLIALLDADHPNHVAVNWRQAIGPKQVTDVYLRMDANYSFQARSPGPGGCCGPPAKH